MQNKKDCFLGFSSTAISFVVAVLCFLSPLIDGNNYFMCGIVLIISVLINLFKYIFFNNRKAEIALNVINLFHTLGASAILLIMLLAPNSFNSSLLLLFIILGIEVLNKGLISIYWLVKKNRKMMWAELILLGIAFHLLINAILIASKTETNVVAILIIGIVINVLVTTFITGRSILDIVDLFIDEKTKFKDKIAYIIKTLKKYHVFFYIGLLFTFGLSISALIAGIKADESLKNSYWNLFIFYFAVALIRLIVFFVHRKNEKECVPTELRRRDNKSLLIVCIVLLLLGDAFGGALALIIQNKSTSSTPLWWYLAIILPFAIIRLVTSINARRKAKKSDDPYLYTTSTIGFITTIYSFIGVIATSYVIIKSDWIALLVVLLIIVAAVLQTIILITQLIKSINGMKNNKVIKEN